MNSDHLVQDDQAGKPSVKKLRKQLQDFQGVLIRITSTQIVEPPVAVMESASSRLTTVALAAQQCFDQARLGVADTLQEDICSLLNGEDLLTSAQMPVRKILVRRH